MISKKLDYPVPLLFVAVFMFLIGMATAAGSDPEPEPAPDHERARFMLECVQDYQNEPATCVAIYNGDEPPLKPDALGEPGC